MEKSFGELLAEDLNDITEEETLIDQINKYSRLIVKTQETKTELQKQLAVLRSGASYVAPVKFDLPGQEGMSEQQKEIIKSVASTGPLTEEQLTKGANVVSGAVDDTMAFMKNLFTKKDNDQSVYYDDESIDPTQEVNGVVYELDDGRIVAIGDDGEMVEVEDLTEKNISDDIDYDEFRVQT